MSGAFAYIVYAAVFVAIVLAVEAAWLFVRTLSPQSREINRRMALIAEKSDPKAALSLMKEGRGGALSHAISERAPWLTQMLWMAKAKISPVALLGVAA